MMLEQLLAELGRPHAGGLSDLRRCAQIQLATAVLLFSVLPADYVIRNVEVAVLRGALQDLLDLPLQKCQRLISRASVAYRAESAMMASATLLKLKSSPIFREQIVAAAVRICLADGENHSFEIDMVDRLSALLAIAAESERRAA